MTFRKPSESIMDRSQIQIHCYTPQDLRAIGPDLFNAQTMNVSCIFSISHASGQHLFEKRCGMRFLCLLCLKWQRTSYQPPHWVLGVKFCSQGSHIHSGIFIFLSSSSLFPDPSPLTALALGLILILHFLNSSANSWYQASSSLWGFHLPSLFLWLVLFILPGKKAWALFSKAYCLASKVISVFPSRPAMST